MSNTDVWLNSRDRAEREARNMAEQTIIDLTKEEEEGESSVPPLEIETVQNIWFGPVTITRPIAEKYGIPCFIDAECGTVLADYYLMFQMLISTGRGPHSLKDIRIKVQLPSNSVYEFSGAPIRVPVKYPLESYIKNVPLLTTQYITLCLFIWIDC